MYSLKEKINLILFFGFRKIFYLIVIFGFNLILSVKFTFLI